MAKRIDKRTKGPRMIQEILRLHEMGLSRRKIARALNCSRNTVDKYLSENRDIASPPAALIYQAPWSDRIDWVAVDAMTRKGDPLSAFWEERVAANPDLGQVPYVTFWREYRRRFPNIPLDLHKIHPPGERCEIDYKGDSPGLGYIDRRTGEFVACRLFGAVLCFSQLFYARATHTERQSDLLESIGKAYSYFGGVPHTSAVDNAKAAVNKAHRYDPDIHREFAYLCEHFGTAPLAMRPGKPKDKNLIENALGVFWRWARRRIRDKTCYSIGELNEFVLLLVSDFNNRIQRKYGTSRREKFAEGEKSKLHPLPDAAYSFGTWKVAKVHPDCHIQIGKNFYSIPHQERGKSLDVRITATMLDVYSDLNCVARHLVAPSRTMGKYITQSKHLPESHIALRESTPQNAIEDAACIGPATELVVKSLIEEARHPLQHLRRVQGILRLAKRYSAASLERACTTVIEIGSQTPRLSDIEALIKSNLDPKAASIIPIQRHPNPYLRGQDAWRQSQEK